MKGDDTVNTFLLTAFNEKLGMLDFLYLMEAGPSMEHFLWRRMNRQLNDFEKAFLLPAGLKLDRQSVA